MTNIQVCKSKPCNNDVENIAINTIISASWLYSYFTKADIQPDQTLKQYLGSSTLVFLFINMYLPLCKNERCKFLRRQFLKKDYTIEILAVSVTSAQ